MLVRLTQRLAECIDGIDLSHRAVDDVFDLAPRDAELLIAEGWAVPAVAVAGKANPPREHVRGEAAAVPSKGYSDVPE
jgi:hypothetical protein